MEQHDYPILEYDAAREAIIEPSRILKPLEGMPEHCVMCFFQEVITDVCGDGKAEIIRHLASEIGKKPIYVLEHEGRRIAVTHAGVGAPLSAGFLEELIAFGCRKFIACGGAGVLKSEIVVGHVVVPESAVRDEGTSYHYLPPSREVSASAEGIAAIKQTLGKHNVPYIVGKTWTTDGIYRETPGKVALRRDEGCLTVEMEAAAFFAVAQFRGASFAQILYGGDDVSGTEWDDRGWLKRASVREKLFWLAVESVLAM